MCHTCHVAESSKMAVGGQIPQTKGKQPLLSNVPLSNPKVLKLIRRYFNVAERKRI